MSKETYTNVGPDFKLKYSDIAKAFNAKKPDTILITSKYKWWKNPIKWYRDRKMIKVMNSIVNEWFANGGRKELENMYCDVCMYGTAFYRDKIIDWAKADADSFYGKSFYEIIEDEKR